MTNVLYSLYSRHSYSLLFFQTVILFRRYDKLTWTLRGSYWNSLKCVRAFQIELEFESVGLLGEGNTAVFGEELLVVRERASKELNPHFALTPSFETELHWKKVGTLTTTPLQTDFAAFLRHSENFWLLQYHEGVSIEKKDWDRNPGSNLDLEPWPFVS